MEKQPLTSMTPHGSASAREGRLASIPVFIGCWKQNRSKAIKERARSSSTAPRIGAPHRLASLEEFDRVFGGTRGVLGPCGGSHRDEEEGHSSGPDARESARNQSTHCALRHSVERFFHDGGAACWVIGIACDGGQLAAACYEQAMLAVEKIPEATRLVVTDAVSLACPESSPSKRVERTPSRKSSYVRHEARPRAFFGKETFAWGRRTAAFHDWRVVPARELFRLVEESVHGG